jgi:hypothetical protein
MELASQLARWEGGRISARLAKTLPWIGAAIAVLTVAQTMRRKGVVRGGLDTALNALPFVGPMKNMAETVCGRDLFADRPRVRPAPVTRPAPTVRHR